MLEHFYNKMIDPNPENNENSAHPSSIENNENNTGGERRFCKICYGTDEDAQCDNEWMHPCKCSGTIKWVHRSCIVEWLDQAPYQQKSQCTMCKYIYRTSWRIKPMSRWCIPDFKLSIWDGLEISLDFMSTYWLYKRLEQLFKGTAKNLWAPYFWAFMYRVFVMNNRRISYYHNIGLRALSSFMEQSILNAQD